VRCLVLDANVLKAQLACLEPLAVTGTFLPWSRRTPIKSGDRTNSPPGAGRWRR